MHSVALFPYGILGLRVRAGVLMWSSSKMILRCLEAVELNLYQLLLLASRLEITPTDRHHCSGLFI